MSAYIVDDKTINSIVASLQTNLVNYDVYPYPPAILACTGGKEAEALAYKLRALNTEAVIARYGDEGPLPGPIGPDGKTADFTYCSLMPLSSLVAFYKTLRCFLYQCMEGSVPGFSLYKALDEYTRDCAERLVQRSKVYDLAEWG